MIDYTFDKKKQILWITLKGDVSIHHFLSLYKEIQYSLNLPDTLKILVDNRKSKSDFNLKEMKMMKEYTERELKQFKYIKEAVVVKSIKDTTSALFFKNITATNNFHFEVFTTLEAATRWLQVDYTDVTL